MTVNIGSGECEKITVDADCLKFCILHVFEAGGDVHTSVVNLSDQ